MKDLKKHKAETAIMDFKKYERNYIRKSIIKSVRSEILTSKDLDTPYNPNDVKVREMYEDVIRYASYSGSVDSLGGVMYSGYLDKIKAGVLTLNNGEQEKVIYTESSAVHLHGSTGSTQLLSSVKFPTLILQSDLRDDRKYRDTKNQRFENFWDFLREIDNDVIYLTEDINDQTWEIELKKRVDGSQTPPTIDPSGN